MVNKGVCTLPAMGQTELSVSYVRIPGLSPLNHDELHVHGECEIYINLQGDVSFEVENRIYPVRRGSVIITRPYEYHHCICHTDALHEHYWITFSVTEQEAGLPVFYHREKGVGNLIELDDADLRQACTLLEKIQAQKGQPLRQRIGFLQLLALLEDAEGGVPERLLPETVEKALAYMEEHLAEDITAGELAKHSNVSINTLERHFQQALGVTPMTQLRKKRLVASMAMLRKGASVTKAALDSGFADDSGYIRYFRKTFGMTPLTYKRLNTSK